MFNYLYPYVIIVCVDENVIAPYGVCLAAVNGIKPDAGKVAQVSKNIAVVRRGVNACHAILAEQTGAHWLRFGWYRGMCLPRELLDAGITKNLKTDSIEVLADSQRRNVPGGEIDKAWCFIGNTLA